MHLQGTAEIARQKLFLVKFAGVYSKGRISGTMAKCRCCHKGDADKPPPALGH